MKIDRLDKDGVTCVAIEGRLDADSAPQAEPLVKAILAEKKTGLLFDLSRMEYISSAGLRIILMAVKDLRNRKGKVVLCGLTPYVREIFDVSNFSSIIPITDTVEAGLQHLH
jgi:anti-anti-sigma factor